MEARRLGRRIEEHIARQELIAPGGEVLCLVSGGADSTALWHVLGALGYRVSALHVNHGLLGRESDADARFCWEAFGASVVEAPHGATEAELRAIRYSFAPEKLRATGHTASDQVETILYRIATSGSTKGIKVRREDGVVRPLLCVWREETEAYCRTEGLAFRVDSSNADTARGLIRREVLPALRQLHPAAERNLLSLAEERPRLPRGLEQTLAALLASRAGSKQVDVGGGLRAVREYDRVWLEDAAVPLEGRVRWGPWLIESDVPGLQLRGWRAGDRLAGRKKKVQDLFVDAKVPRSEREAWPLVVRGEDVVAVPGIAAAPGFEHAVRARRSG